MSNIQINSSYKKTLKTTGLIGLVQLFKLFFGFFQNKFLAIILGPSGIGIWGLFNSYVQMVSSFSTFGMDQAGVKEISKCTDNKIRVDKVIYVLRLTILVVASLFAGFSMLFSKTFSFLLFGDEKYFFGIIIVSFAIFFNSISQYQVAILNGFRNIKAIAKSQITGVIIGGVAAVVSVYFLREKGIPFFILIVSLTIAVISQFFLRKYKIDKVNLSFKEFFKIFNSLISVGLGIAYSAILVAISTYLIQTYLRKEFGLDVLGIYNASFTISNIYVGVILSAMGMDLLPRLSSVIEDKFKVNLMLNNQMELGVLISSFGVLLIVLFSPLFLKLLYSSKFISGKSIIQWQILGVFLRVLAFPLGYVLIIKKKTIKYMIVQTIMWLGNYFLLIIFTKLYGLNALGVNYLVAYVLYVTVLFLFTYKEFKVSKLLKSVFSISLLFICSSWYLVKTTEGAFFNFLAIIILICNAFWILSTLQNKMNINLLSFLRK